MATRTYEQLAERCEQIARKLRELKPTAKVLDGYRMRADVYVIEDHLADIEKANELRAVRSAGEVA